MLMMVQAQIPTTDPDWQSFYFDGTAPYEGEERIVPNIYLTTKASLGMIDTGG